MTEKEQLQELVNSCNSFTDILRTMNKSISGDAVNLLKKKLDEYGIVYNFVYEKSFRNKIPLEEILVENRPYKSQDLKNRLIKEGIKQDVCEICGQTNIWQGKQLVLQLDHINGNHNDNRLENLRILCPNCHTQTNTFSNKKPKKYCPDCGIEITSKSTYCRTCSAKHRDQRDPNKEYPDKETLWNLIQTTSFTEIGRMYNATDNAVRKWCKKLGLPSTKREIKEMLAK